MGMFLSKNDINILTGARTKEAQMKELSSKGIPFECNSKGDILILCSEIEHRLGGTKAKSPRARHNFDALRKSKDQAAASAKHKDLSA